MHYLQANDTRSPQKGFTNWQLVDGGQPLKSVVKVKVLRSDQGSLLLLAMIDAAGGEGGSL